MRDRNLRWEKEGVRSRGKGLMIRVIKKDLAWKKVSDGRWIPGRRRLLK